MTDNFTSKTDGGTEPVVVVVPILCNGVDPRRPGLIVSGVKLWELGVVVASKSITGVRTPKFVQRKENLVVNGVIVEIDELTDIVGENVEVPRDPLHIDTDTTEKTKTVNIKSQPLQSWNLGTDVHNASNILFICIPNNGLSTKEINERL